MNRVSTDSFQGSSRMSSHRPGNADWSHPFHWWGSQWSIPNGNTLRDLVESEAITIHLATLFRTLMRLRTSIFVVSRSGGAGKSTLLRALLEELSPDIQRVFIRGSYEPFDFTESTVPTSSVICVNEISPHLPIYLWGPPVRTFLEFARVGYQLAATMHASSIEEFIHQLSTQPLRIPVEEIAFPKIVIQLSDPPESGEAVIRVERVTAIFPGIDQARSGDRP